MSETTTGVVAHFTNEDLAAGLVTVVEMTILEELSRDAQCVVSGVLEGGTIDPRSLLDKPATTFIVREGEILRRFHGVVQRVSEKATTIEGRQELRIVLRPLLALLDHSCDRRVHRDKSSKDVVALLLGEAGVAASSIEWRLASPPKPRETCTQYGETTRAFVDRILAEDGITWFTDHREDGPHLVFADSPSGYSPDDGGDLPFRHTSALRTDDEIDSIDAWASVRPAKVTLGDRDFTKPSLDLQKQATSDSAFGREHYEFPGGYVDPAVGGARAQSMMAAHVARTQAIRVRGHAPRLTAGHTVKLVETPDGHYDGEYVAVEVVHRYVTKAKGSDAIFTSKARLLDSKVRFAPPSVARPRARGDLAMVTTPGDDIHCDEHGRIKVQYHWDRYGARDDKSSGWTRVSQMHTSGSVVIPRRSWEVLVEFEHGDPDRPLVIGRLYNAASPPTDPLPAGKTNSVLRSNSSPGSAGHNEIRMNDGGGSELVNVHAEKDLNLVVANDKQEKVATSSTMTVGADHSVTVGADQTEQIGATDSLTVGGSQKWAVGGSRTKTVTGGDGLDVTGARSVSIGGSHTTMTPMAVGVSTAGSLSETVGGMCLEVAALEVGMAVAGSASITVGAAKVEAVAAAKSEFTLGAKATTIGGAFINVTPKDVNFGTKGAKVTTVGGAWAGAAASDAEWAAGGNISVTVGGAIAMNAASIKLKVGSSNVTISGGQVVLDSPEIKFTASAMLSETAPMVASK